VLDAYQIPAVKTLIATTPEECSKAAAGIGFPVAIRSSATTSPTRATSAASPSTCRSAPEAANQFTKIVERVEAAMPEARIIGVAVQAMSRGGYEVIIGSKKDPTFGPR